MCSSIEPLVDPAPAEYLKCAHACQQLIPSGVLSNESGYFTHERIWWLRYEPHARPWIEAAIKSGEVESPIEAWHGANTLLSAGYETGSWDKLTGHELLFEHLGHGGLLEGWSCTNTIVGMRSFMKYLTSKGVVDRVFGTRLVTDIDAWESRIVAYFDEDGPWYFADGSRPSLSTRLN